MYICINMYIFKKNPNMGRCIVNDFLIKIYCNESISILDNIQVKGFKAQYSI